MQIITSNPFYEVKVNKTKNRFYVKVIGFWDSPGIIPGYIEHVREAVSELKVKFTAILDLSDMVSHPQYVEEQAHQAASLIAIKKGLYASVQILPKDPQARVQIERIATKLHKKLVSFEDFKSADTFLDDYLKNNQLKKNRQKV
jgi:hypothetical protein